MSVMRSKKKALKQQRALILGGGGALGAYQAGVLKILCKILIEEDKRKGENNQEYWTGRMSHAKRITIPTFQIWKSI